MKYTTKIFNNGLKLATITNLSTNAVTVTACIKAGFKYDPPNRPGLSHFTEHLIFNATRSFPKIQSLAQTVERNGGWRNAFTWIEHQEHIVHLPKDNFEDGLKLILGSIFEPTITDPEIQKEKGVIKEEILRNKADPARAIWDYVWFPLFFQGTNLARSYVGNADDILKISKSDIESFINKYFKPENTVIFVAGNLEETHIQEAVGKYAKNYKVNYKKVNIPALDPKIKNNVFVQIDNFYYQTSLSIGIKTVPFNSPLKYTFDVLKEMLAGYFSTPLIQKLRDEGGLIYTWEAFQDNFINTGYLLLNFTVAHKNVNRVISIILEEFKRFAEGKFMNDEIQMAKSHLRGILLANIETGQDYIKWYGLQELLNPQDVLSIEDQIDVYNKIKTEQIKKVAADYFKKENILIGVLGKSNQEQTEKLLH